GIEPKPDDRGGDTGGWRDVNRRTQPRRKRQRGDGRWLFHLPEPDLLPVVAADGDTDSELVVGGRAVGNLHRAVVAEQRTARSAKKYGRDGQGDDRFPGTV